MNDTRTIFFIGKPGCGKGLQARLLSEYSKWPVISSGSQFRAIAAEDTPVGKKTRAVDETGELQPHWFAMYLYLKSLFGLPDGQNVIFDGFCRKVPEAQLVMDSLTWLGRSFTVIHLSISDETVHARVEKRSQTHTRADDAKVEERLVEYQTYTEPALELFRNEGSLIEIDGEQTPEVIAELIRKELGLA